MAESPKPRDQSEAEAAEVARELELIRRHRERTPPARPARRMLLTLVTTGLIALALWLAMR